MDLRDRTIHRIDEVEEDVPAKGRDEEALSRGGAWVRHHDSFTTASARANDRRTRDTSTEGFELLPRLD
jgi:hypothetical protein